MGKCWRFRQNQSQTTAGGVGPLQPSPLHHLREHPRRHFHLPTHRQLPVQPRMGPTARPTLGALTWPHSHSLVAIEDAPSAQDLAKTLPVPRVGHPLTASDQRAITQRQPRLSAELAEWHVSDQRKDLARELAPVVGITWVWLPFGSLALPLAHRAGAAFGCGSAVSGVSSGCSEQCKGCGP